jgi:hypothetical protein
MYFNSPLTVIITFESWAIGQKYIRGRPINQWIYWSIFITQIEPHPGLILGYKSPSKVRSWVIFYLFGSLVLQKSEFHDILFKTFPIVRSDIDDSVKYIKKQYFWLRMGDFAKCENANIKIVKRWKQ